MYSESTAASTINPWENPDAIKILAVVTTATCEHCHQPFELRNGSGGKKKRFCSAACRKAFNNSRRPPPSETLAETLKKSPTPQTETLASTPKVKDSNKFDWNDVDIVQRELRETAIYWNTAGDLVIRQRAAWNEEDDPFLVIGANNVQEFIDRLCDMVGIPSVGGRS
jgi:hypothetical protein